MLCLNLLEKKHLNWHKNQKENFQHKENLNPLVQKEVVLKLILDL